MIVIIIISMMIIIILTMMTIVIFTMIIIIILHMVIIGILTMMMIIMNIITIHHPNQEGAGSKGEAGPNLVHFIRKLKSLLPGFLDDHRHPHHDDDHHEYHHHPN